MRKSVSNHRIFGMTPSDIDKIVHRHKVVLLFMVLHNLVEFWRYLFCCRAYGLNKRTEIKKNTYPWPIGTTLSHQCFVLWEKQLHHLLVGALFY